LLASGNRDFTVNLRSFLPFLRGTAAAGIAKVFVALCLGTKIRRRTMFEGAKTVVQRFHGWDEGFDQIYPFTRLP
jgi:hypothetical protein